MQVTSGRSYEASGHKDRYVLTFFGYKRALRIRLLIEVKGSSKAFETKQDYQLN